MRRIVFLVPVLLFVGIGAFLYTGLNRGAPTALPSPLIGKPVPAIEMTALEEGGETFSRGDLAQGKPVIVNFWASWCAPCRIEAPILEELSRRGDLALYGIAYKDEPALARKFLDEFGNPFARIAGDPTGRIGIEWGISGVPETFVIDGGGIIRARFAGPLTEDVVREVIIPAAGL